MNIVSFHEMKRVGSRLLRPQSVMVVSVLIPLTSYLFCGYSSSVAVSGDFMQDISGLCDDSMELRPWVSPGNGHCNFSCPFEFGFFFFSFSGGPLTLIVHKIQISFVTKLWITKVIFNSLFCMAAFKSKVYQARYLLVRFTPSLSDCEMATMVLMPTIAYNI